MIWCFVKWNIESGELLFFSVRLILKGSLDVHDSLSAVHLCAPLTSGEARIYLKKNKNAEFRLILAEEFIHRCRCFQCSSLAEYFYVCVLFCCSSCGVLLDFLSTAFKTVGVEEVDKVKEEQK